MLNPSSSYSDEYVQSLLDTIESQKQKILGLI